MAASENALNIENKRILRYNEACLLWWVKCGMDDVTSNENMKLQEEDYPMDKLTTNRNLRSDDMKCELLSEHNLALMLDFIDDENTKYDQAVLKAFLNEKNAYGYIASDNGKAVGFAYGYVLNEPDGQKVYYLHAIDVMDGWQNQGYGTELVRFVHEHSKALGCRKMFLLTNKHNVSACRCYEKAGGICNAASDDIVFAFK